MSIRDEIDSAVGAVLFNASNYPRSAMPHMLGQDIGPLREKVVEAVLAAVQPPTREQVAEALYLDDADHEDWSWATEDNPLTRAAYLKNADVVLALFPQPTPSAEPKPLKPEAMQRALDYHGWPPRIADMAPGTTDEERIRRDERMRWAIYLWGMDEDADEPEGAFEEGAHMAYHAVAAWLLANIARGFKVSDMPWLDPDLIADAKQKARLLPAHPDSEVHEVDRCIATLATIRDVTPPK